MRHYYAMYLDELGEEHRYNSAVYTFPDFDESDEIAYEGFRAWKSGIVSALYDKEGRTELRIFLDRDDREKFGGFNCDWF